MPGMNDLPRQRVVELAGRSFAVLNGDGEAGVANSTVLVDGDDATVIDSMLLPEMARLVLGEARRRGVHPRVVVNTHHHIDHVGGNRVFADARVVAHPATAAMVARMVDERPPFEKIVPRYAARLETHTLLVPDPLDVAMLALPEGGRLLAFGPAHTPVDLAVWFPDARVLVSGDLCFNGVTPLAVHGDVAGWISALDALLALDPAVVVPGHGPLATAGDLVKLRTYLQGVLAAAIVAVDQDAAPEEVLRTLDPGPVGGWLESERTHLNLQVAMRAVAAQRVRAGDSAAE